MFNFKFEDLCEDLEERGHNPDLDFWDEDPGFLKTRRQNFFRRLLHVFTKRVKSRWLRPTQYITLQYRFFYFNRLYLNLFRKYLYNFKPYNFASSVALKSKHFTMRSLIFCDFLKSNGVGYTWYNLFSKKKFFFKKKIIQTTNYAFKKRIWFTYNRRL